MTAGDILMVALGGAVGSVARYVVSGYVSPAVGGGFATFSTFANENLSLMRPAICSLQPCT